MKTFTYAIRLLEKEVRRLEEPPREAWELEEVAKANRSRRLAHAKSELAALKKMNG